MYTVVSWQSPEKQRLSVVWNVALQVTITLLHFGSAPTQVLSTFTNWLFQWRTREAPMKFSVFFVSLAFQHTVSYPCYDCSFYYMLYCSYVHISSHHCLSYVHINSILLYLQSVLQIRAFRELHVEHTSVTTDWQIVTIISYGASTSLGWQFSLGLVVICWSLISVVTLRSVSLTAWMAGG